MDGTSSSASESQRPDNSDDEHFSDASEGGARNNVPEVPTTRIEKVDDEPRHGEVPGTHAHEIRTQDAKPDEVEVIPDSGSESFRHQNTTQTDIPTTVIEKVDVEERHHGEVPGTVAYDMRKADASADFVKEAPASSSADLEGSPTPKTYRPIGNTIPASSLADEADSSATRDDAGDDFDEFELGSEDDDFGAFDEGDEEVAPPTDGGSSQQVGIESASRTARVFDFEGLDDLQDITTASASILGELFPTAKDSHDEQLPDINTAFLTERSQSLWEQLVALPPLQPPDWIRSRIRRLFLVSLGVPVDLDEILPASKQKKLVLPSMDVARERSLSQSTESRPNGAAEGAKHARTLSGTTVQTTKKSERSKKRANPVLDFDLNSARLLSSTTEAALGNFTDAELRAHVKTLEELRQASNGVLQHWVIQKDSALGDKAAFEEVIENLVKHAKKIRK